MDESERPRGQPLSLRDALRAARVEAAEQASVVVELRDAELARLAMLNEMLEPIFAELPLEHADMFDRGLMPGATPRLFIDMVAHVSMAHDKRTYRFIQDTRSGRRILAESASPTDIADAVTRYVARRLIAREQAMTGYAPDDPALAPRPLPHAARRLQAEEDAPAPPSRRGAVVALVVGLCAGALLAAAALTFIPR